MEPASQIYAMRRQQQLGQLGDKGILLLRQSGGRLRAIVSQSVDRAWWWQQQAVTPWLNGWASLLV